MIKKIISGGLEMLKEGKLRKDSNPEKVVRENGT